MCYTGVSFVNHSIQRLSEQILISFYLLLTQLQLRMQFLFVRSIILTASQCYAYRFPTQMCDFFSPPIFFERGEPFNCILHLFTQQFYFYQRMIIYQDVLEQQVNHYDIPPVLFSHELFFSIESQKQMFLHHHAKSPFIISF